MCKDDHHINLGVMVPMIPRKVAPARNASAKSGNKIRHLFVLIHEAGMKVEPKVFL